MSGRRKGLPRGTLWITVSFDIRDYVARPEKVSIRTFVEAGSEVGRSRPRDSSSNSLFSGHHSDHVCPHPVTRKPLRTDSQPSTTSLVRTRRREQLRGKLSSAGGPTWRPPCATRARPCRLQPGASNAVGRPPVLQVAAKAGLYDGCVRRRRVVRSRPPDRQMDAAAY